MNTNYILTDRQTGINYSVVPKGLSEKGELEMWAILVDDEEALKRLKSLEGEPLFWEVHSTLRRVALRTLKQWTNCSMQELYWMKKAEDYEAYLSCKDTPVSSRRYLPTQLIINNDLRDEISKRHQNGESINTLADTYGLSYEDIHNVLSDIRENPNRERYCVINSAIAEIIRYGIARGVTPKTVANSLNISSASVYRATRNVFKYQKSDGIRKRYEEGKLLSAERRFVFPGENFYMFSLRKYCGLSECPKWCETFVKGGEEIESKPIEVKVEDPQQDEATEECKQEESVGKSLHTEKSIQNEKEISVPVKIEKDGHNLTLTININLSL